MLCFNELNGTFLNACHAQDPGFAVVVANYIMQWVNPRTLAITTLSMILILPVLTMSGKSSTKLQLEEIANECVSMRWKLLNFLHRLCYSLVLDVALYAAFRQSRPCKCLQNGSLSHIGSIYGMPSGDAMAGALFGAYLFEAAPFSAWGSRIVAVISVFLVCFERVVLGYHSIGQVTVGASLGIILHIYSTRAPQFMIFVDAVVQLVLGAILLPLDPALVYKPHDTNNLMSWFLWGVSFQVFVVMMIFWHFRRHSSLLRQSLVSLQSSRSYSLLHDEDERLISINESFQAEKAQIFKLTSSGWVFISFLALTAVNILSWCVSAYDILSSVQS